MIPSMIKNPDKNNGANKNWSNAIDVNTRVAFEVDSLNIKLPIFGRIWQYQLCNIGAKYNDPTINKLKFLL